MSKELPVRWDIEADFISIGSGIGGLSAAITASDQGLKSVVLERTDEVGGVTALSAGEVWVPGNHLARAMGIEDSPQSGYRYLKQLSMGNADDRHVLNFAVNAREALTYFSDKAGLKMAVIPHHPDYYFGISNDGLGEGRMLEVEPFPASELGEWQARTRITPFMPYGMTHPDMSDNGGVANMARWDYTVMAERLAADERCLGPGLAAYFVKAALDRGIPLETGFNVEKLVWDGERVIGVQGTRDGRMVFAKASKGVLIATSSFEKNRDLNRTLGQQIDVESMLFPAIDGANIRMAGALGAQIATVPDVTLIGFQVPGEALEDGSPLWRVALPNIGLPHTIVVNRAGKRFGNEGFYRAFCYDLDRIDGVTQTYPNYPCWAILDSQAREKYPFGSVMPGEDLPEGLGVKADTLGQLARMIGVDPQGLERTVASFNDNAERGTDPEFGRGEQPWARYNRGDINQNPNPNLGPLVKSPFYAVRLHRMGGSAIPATGLVTDVHSRVVDWEGKTIEGLYSAGNSVARLETGAMMQSGVSNARGMTHGYLAGLHASGNPSKALNIPLAQLDKWAAGETIVGAGQ